MRSRYTAFTRSDEDYLRATWDPATCPQVIGLNPRARWNGPGDRRDDGRRALRATGTVEFRAHHAGGVVEENSAFRRLDGRWVYVGPSV